MDGTTVYEGFEAFPVKWPTLLKCPACGAKMLKPSLKRLTDQTILTCKYCTMRSKAWVIKNEEVNL